MWHCEEKLDYVQHIQHTAGIYGFFTSLAQTARREPGLSSAGGRRGSVCERRYRVGEQWYNLRPDALAEYRIGQQQMRVLVGVGSRHHECARSGDQVHLLRALHRLA